MSEFNDTERESKVKQENVKAQMSNFNKPTNPPAFPIANLWHNELKQYNGMTLRDYMAASFVESGHIFKSMSDGNTPELVAEQAYALADAMLKAREA